MCNHRTFASSATFSTSSGRRVSLRATLGALTLGLAFAASPAYAQQAEPTDPAAPPSGDLTPESAPAQPTEREASANPLAAEQLEAIKKEINSQPKQVEFHGYFRAGFGVNSKGGDQETFQAPGAYSKYRLGNEGELYGEIALDNNWVNPDRSEAWFKTSVKVAVVAPRNQTFDLIDPFAMREAYAEAGKILTGHPEVTFWAGERFYRRRDVHITDFFHNDTSGYGAGFQDLKVGEKAKLSIAYLGGSVQETSDVGRFAKNALDIRLHDIPVGNGNLEFFLFPTLGAVGDDGDPDANRSGVGGGVFHFIPFMGGFNELSVQFGYGGSANFAPTIETIGSGGWLLRVVERATIQPSPQLSMQWTGVLQLDNKNGDNDGESSTGNMWISAGVRPVYAFTKYIGIAAEAGIDFVQPQQDGADSGMLGKLTIAPLIRPGMDFWARPELRAFVTAAFWTESIQGAVGGDTYADDTFGLTAGVQMESWW